MLHGSRVTARAGSPPSPPKTLHPGQVLGKYEIVERLATGGMAELFLARAHGMLGFGKPVVIKRILPHLATRNDFVEMFLDEARIATTLTHPNLVQTFEVGVHEGSYYLAMEYVAGEDLRAIARRLDAPEARARLPLEHAIAIVVGVAAGLHYAHERRDFDGRPLDIVHRDVSPQNVIVSYDGVVKLLDFGIAKAQNRITETRGGSFKGKVSYLSPEQCRAEPLDRRSDVYALGILLWELTLGRCLFRGDSDFQILKQIVDGAVIPPRALDPGYDAALEAIVMKALAGERDQRFPSARALGEALEAWAHERRLRLSTQALGDWVRGTFADRAARWDAAAEISDVGRLSEHVAALAEEREADRIADEKARAASPTPAGARRRSQSQASARSREGTPVETPVLPSLPLDAMDEDPPLAPLSVAPSAEVDVVPPKSVPGAVATTAAAPTATAPTAPPPAIEVAKVAAVEPLPDGPARSRATAVWWSAALLAVAGVVIVIGVRSLRGRPALDTKSEPAVVAAPPVAVAPPAPAAVPPETPSPPPAPAPAATAIEVRTEPKGATILVDGVRHAARSPARLEGLAPGAEHAITVRLSGYRAVVHRVTLAPGEEAAFDVALKRGSGVEKPARPAATSAPAAAPSASAPAAVDGEGSLVFASSPWCTVTVDGQERGTTPLVLKVKSGAHKVVFANPEYKIRRTLTVDVKPGETVKKRLDFAVENP